MLNILATRNRESRNLEIGVPVLGNRLFCAWLRVHFYRNISQGIAASAVRSSLYEYSCRNYHSVCTKVNLKSDFHITGQLIETHPEYSIICKYRRNSAHCTVKECICSGEQSTTTKRVSYAQKLRQWHGLWRHKCPIDTAFEIWPFVIKQNKGLLCFPESVH